MKQLRFWSFSGLYGSLNDILTIIWMQIVRAASNMNSLQFVFFVPIYFIIVGFELENCSGSIVFVIFAAIAHLPPFYSFITTRVL